MNTKHAAYSAQGRYLTMGDKQTASSVWIILHGYGQLAQYFLRSFSSLTDQGVYVIAPEATSRFYLQDTETRMRTGNNRVGATWMTKEDRLTDITNYIAFLNAVYESELRDNSKPVTVLGFSQGAATATRWILDGQVNFSQLILWAGIFPSDIDFQNGKTILSNKRVVLAYGLEDPFLNDERFAEMKLISEKLGVHPEVITFQGKHAMDEPTLLKIFSSPNDSQR